MEKRFPINFRAFLIVAVAVTVSVFCLYLYMVSTVAGITANSVLLCAITALFVVFTVKCKRGKIKLRVPIGLGIALVLSVVAFTVGVVSYENWRDCARFDGYYAVSGRVCAIDARSGECRIELDDLSIGGNGAPGKMCITVDGNNGDIAELVNFGDVLNFSADVNVYRLYNSWGVRGSNYRTDIRYYANVSGGNIVIKFGDPKPLEAMLSGIHSIFVDNMGDRYGNIAYSMMTGDKHTLYSGVSDYYSAVGLGHIMAVSGLHIGFVIMLLGFLLSKVNKKISVPIMLVFALGYAVLADFSPSVVRAVIMATVSSMTVFFSVRRDMLSSVFFAYSVILAVKPLYLFDVGFLLSFGAIGGIALFANSIRRALVNKNANRKISNAVGAATAVNIGVMPAQIYYFGNIQILSIIVNIVLLPFITVIFTVTLLLLAVAAIPGCGIVLTLSKWLFAALDYTVYGLSFVPFANIAVRVGAGIFVCYPIMFCASEYFMIERGKKIVALYSAVICVLIALICAL